MNLSFLRRSRGIGFRLRFAFATLIAIGMVMALVGAWRLSELGRATERIARVNIRVERVVGAWYAETKSNAVRAVVLTHSDDEELKRLLAPELEATSQRISELQKEVEKVIDGPEARALFDDVGARRSAYLGIRKAVLEKKKAGQAQEALAMLDKSMLPAVAAYVASIKRLVDHYAKQGEHDAAAADAAAQAARNLLVSLAAAALALGVVFSWLIGRSITAPLAEAVDLAARVADGDLSVEVAEGDDTETGRLLTALSRMTANLRRLLGAVAEGAQVVTTTSAQIAQGNLELSQRTEEQASTLEETASSMEELTTTVARNADNARRASERAAGATETAREGGQVFADVVATMNGISGSSKQIADIVGVIDSIAFQTNILALNAAVEAARAGEQGRGFAVVATEVRNLAHRSAAAAKEIKALIGTSVADVEAGAALVTRAGTTMDQIVRSIREVDELVAEIAAASREQSSGLEQVNTAVSQMEHVVQQNASLVEEASAGTEAMKSQAVSLLDLVARFKLGAGFAAAAAVPAASPKEHAHEPPPLRERPVPTAPTLKPVLPGGRARHALASGGQWQTF